MKPDLSLVEHSWKVLPSLITTDVKMRTNKRCRDDSPHTQLRQSYSPNNDILFLFRRALLYQLGG